MPNWEEFKKKHILNPNKNRGYESWDRNDQNRWLRDRLTGFSGRYAYGNKPLNSVIIATSQEVLEDFQTPGVAYTPRDRFYWSNRQYPIWLFKKRGEDYSVLKLNERHGPMHVCALVSPPEENNRPIHFHAQAPSPSNNPPQY